LSTNFFTEQLTIAVWLLVKQAGWSSWPDYDPSSERPSLECPWASIAARHCATSSIRTSRRASCYCSNAIAGITIGANFKIYLLRQFCLNRVNFFTIHRRHRRKKRWTRILKFELCDFENFLKFPIRRRAVPLRLIWTIMVAAKLDHSRVLVTKIHQNWSKLKGRSASQRHTDRQTDKLGWK